MGGMLRLAIQEAVLRNEFKVYSDESILPQDGRRGGVPVDEAGRTGVHEGHFRPGGWK